jgi:hypothetical protein
MQLAPSEKIFWVTGAVYANLLESYQASGRSGSETQFHYLTDGTPVLKYNGIEVQPLWLIDNYLSTDTTCPWYDVVRNFIIYTPKASSKFSNLVLGTEKAADLDRVDVFFDQRLLTTYAQAEVRFGVNFINCDLTSIYH